MLSYITTQSRDNKAQLWGDIEGAVRYSNATQPTAPNLTVMITYQ
jgi:hypothetical protein